MPKRRRRKVAIFLVVVSTLIIFAYARKEIFFQKAKRLIEQNLEKSLPCEFSIGRLRSGLLYGLVLENLEISFPEETFGLALKMKIEQALINYDSMNKIHLAGGQISFGQSPPLLRNLQGELLFNHKELYLQDIAATFKNNPRKTLKIYGRLSQDKLALTANLEHLKAGNFDILTNLSLALDRRDDLQANTPKISGTLKSYGSVLNNRPLPELNSSFEIQDEKLRILSFSLGDSYDLRGIVSLAAPVSADLSLNFHQAAPHELIPQFTQPLNGGAGLSLSEQPNFSGLVNGLIKITGDMRQPKIDGYLEVKQGHLGDLTFVSADINIEGQYPRIAVVDSRICREEDSFLMEGEIDFTNLAGQRAMDIELKADKGMLWQGWDITRGRENQVHMSKSIAEDLKVTFDSFAEEQAVGFEEDYINELGLEYRVFGDKLLRVRLRKEEGILGVERRIKF